MKIRKGIIGGALLVFTMCLVGCKSQDVAGSPPFSIEEKAYFYWVGGKQGTEGTTVRIEGSTTALNLSFSKVFFQNYEYTVVPEFRNGYFILEGTRANFRKQDQVLSSDRSQEYGNQPPPIEKNIPFDLEDDEAIILYTVSGREAYYKVTDIKKLDKVYRP